MAASPKILEWSKLLESYCKIVHTFKNRQVFLVLRLQTPHASMVFFRILNVRLKCIDHKRQLLNFFYNLKLSNKEYQILLKKLIKCKILVQKKLLIYLNTA